MENIRGVCGFTGELAADGPADPAATARMADRLAPRGPDGHGTWAGGRLALSHRRLKIIDLSERAAQPMVDPQLGLVVVFNGCVYNYRELRAELEAAGYAFFSRSDTEVVAKAYAHWGADCVQRFRGMFAFAVAEIDSGRLVLVRDRLGIKPLYVADLPGGRLRFASTLPALLAGGEIDDALDPVALHHFFSWHAVVPAPHTVLRGVRKLPPASVLVIEPDGRRVQRTYWEPHHERPAERAPMAPQEWADAVLDGLRTAVARRMVADVPVGVLLSGGLDSSIIVALLAEAGRHGLKTFSIGFASSAERAGDEFAYSDAVAKRYATEHTRWSIPTPDIAATLPDAIAAMSEPMVSHDAVAFYLLSREVSRACKVVQCGQGADEIFAGYSWYPPLQRASGLGDDAYAREFFDRPHDEIAELLESAHRCDDDVSRAFVAGHFARPGAETALDRALRLDTRHARRRPGQARRQHDDGLGARGSHAVSRPRPRRARRLLPARAEARRRRQGRAEGGRPHVASGRRRRSREGLLPRARAVGPDGRAAGARARRPGVACRPRARADASRVRREAARRPAGPPHDDRRQQALADRPARAVAAGARGGHGVSTARKASFDEAWVAPGRPRAHYAELLSQFASSDVALLRASLSFAMAEKGVTFGERPFEVCPMPRLLTAGEAASLAAGLEQRVRALNAFVVDAYGERRIVAAGRLAGWIIDSSAGYEPTLAGRWPGGPTPIGVAGLDLVRGHTGEPQVLEDNVRTPSGYAYAISAARALHAALPFDVADHDDGADALLERLAAAVREALPSRPDPAVVVITDGQRNSAYFEHALAASHLGARLLRVDELLRDGDRLLHRDERGGEHGIDVVYRRCDEDRIFDEHGEQTLVGERLLEPWLAGNIAIVNGFGTGVADDKLAHGYVEEMVRFYLEEEPLLRSVPTLDLTRDENLGRLLEAPEEYVVKPRAGQGGGGVVVCAHADQRELQRCLADVRERPDSFVAQPLIALSTVPTVIGDSLVPRHVDLRPFIFSAPGWTRAVPSGLTRVAWDAGALVVNSSQDGGGKVTWALR